MRLLQLAQECKNLISMIHVSSAYVNCNQKGGTVIPEDLMNINVNPEEFINKLAEMNP